MRADGSSVFVRRGEEVFTSKDILDAERKLAALPTVRELPSLERDRRFAAGRQSSKMMTLPWLPKPSNSPPAQGRTGHSRSGTAVGTTSFQAQHLRPCATRGATSAGSFTERLPSPLATP